MARTDLKVPSIFLIFLSKENPIRLNTDTSINGPVNNKITSFYHAKLEHRNLINRSMIWLIVFTARCDKCQITNR